MLDYHLSQDPVNAYRVAEDYSIIGDYEKSINWLERAVEDRNFFMVTINVDPNFKRLEFRSNPRFQAILKKMNFPD